MSADGTWETTTNTPMGPQKGQLTLSTDGDTLTGTMSSPQGSLDISDGQVDGNNVSWKADITSPMPMTLEFKATIDGDSMSGEVKLGAFGTGSLSGTRI